MNAKMIFVLVDGLSEAVAKEKMGFMKLYTEEGIARHTVLQCELPSLSRPLYHTLMTGLKPSEHAVLTNINRSKPRSKTLFDHVAAAGGQSAAAAYHWFSELYLHGFDNSFKHRFRLNGDAPIHHGIFYYEDHYPDTHLFMDADFLIEQFQPNFIVVHSMNVDDAGHRLDAVGYGHAVRKIDGILAHFVPAWLKKGYQVVVTSDHGMGTDGAHGGDCNLEREVPFWFIGPQSTVLPKVQTECYAFVLENFGLGGNHA